jgi:hypothetical protein
MADTKKAAPGKTDETDPYWWTPWAVLAALVLFGLLGFLGKLGGQHEGPTAADVPVTPPPASSAK